MPITLHVKNLPYNYTYENMDVYQFPKKKETTDQGWEGAAATVWALFDCLYEYY